MHIPADRWAGFGPATIIRADARNLPLADSTVDLIVTSPPYFALRSYQDGGEHYDGESMSDRRWTRSLADDTTWLLVGACRHCGRPWRHGDCRPYGEACCWTCATTSDAHPVLDVDGPKTTNERSTSHGRQRRGRDSDARRTIRPV